MDKLLKSKNIILGITGGIAAYKAAELARLLVKSGANVQVVMTDAAKEFITELTMQALTGNAVRSSMFDCTAELGMSHIELAKWADAMVIAPATANSIAKLANGMADDLLSTVYLAMDSTKAVYVAPAMNTVMWHNELVQQNITKLSNLKNCHILGPGVGEQACGDTGLGRMLEPEEIIRNLDLYALSSSSIARHCEEQSDVAIQNNKTRLFRCAHNDKEIESVANKKILITAGPTQENIDPVRFISNHSSGKMGYSLANAAITKGYDVTLVSGPVDQDLIDSLNSKIKLVKITTADQMLAAVQKLISVQDIFIAVAAVADYKCNEISAKKIKKQGDYLDLRLAKNPDILKQVGEYKKNYNNRLINIGFAAETDDLYNNAKKKLSDKNLDFIILNNVKDKSIAFNSEYNQVTIIDKNNKMLHLDKQRKDELAVELLEYLESYIENLGVKQSYA